MDFQFELNFDDVFEGTDHIKNEDHIIEDTTFAEETLNISNEEIKIKEPPLSLYDIRKDEDEEDQSSLDLKPDVDIALKPEENDDTSMGMQDSSINEQICQSVNDVSEMANPFLSADKNNEVVIKKEPIEDEFIDNKEPPLLENIKEEVNWEEGYGVDSSAASSSTGAANFNRKSLKKLNVQQRQDINNKSATKDYYIYVNPRGKLKKRKKWKFDVNVAVEFIDLKSIEDMKRDPEKWKGVMKTKVERNKKEKQKLNVVKKKKKKEKKDKKKKKSPNIETAEINIKVEPSSTVIKQEPQDDIGTQKPKRKNPHRPVPRVRCKYCNLLFSSQSYLTVHERIHTGEKPYECDVCHKKFNSRHSLNLHKKSHSNERKFECEVCHILLKNKLTYNEHLNIHTGAKPYKCETCGKRFAQSSVYRLHIKIHTGIKQFKCEYCDKSFRQKITMQNHVYAIHTHEKPFPCTLCEKKFHRSDALLMHMRMHQDIKLWQCKICALKFRTTSCLNRHMTTHTKQKRFKCDKCDFEAARKDSLATHYRTHTGERPYKCELCEMTFATLSTRKLHMRRHTGEKPHECPVCKYRFTESSGLRRHLRRMHLRYFEEMEEKRIRKKERLEKTIENNLARIQEEAIKESEKESGQ
ncbi:zinc finger protein 675-like [Clytia hemisphaerica]|uniref:C2H2-type domain-containing protein n=1 Tax=Clytia hemisphaerica TaxID=252671 RepID=A0A7M5TV40_9CNID